MNKKADWDKREFDENGEEIPMFESIDEAGRAYGWSQAQIEKARADLELTAKYPPDGVPPRVVH